MKKLKAIFEVELIDAADNKQLYSRSVGENEFNFTYKFKFNPSSMKLIGLYEEDSKEVS